jgi:hemolysin III
MSVINKIKEPGSAITHFIGFCLAAVAAIPLLIKAAGREGNETLYCMLIFILSMMLLYAASTTYHTFDINGRVNRILQKIDHSAICVLIAGTYTPVCLLVLKQPTGIRLCILVWSIAIAGIIIKLFWITCPKWFSSVLYIGMGWACVTAFPSLLTDLSRTAFYWFLAGGILYTAGGILYALKLPSFNSRHPEFGTHEIFHLFVMGGSICHFIAMYLYIA